MAKEFTIGLLRKAALSIALTAAAVATLPTAAQAASHHHGHAVLQCAPYAREVSGIDLHGRAADWWGQAEGVYARGTTPREGAVLAFRSTHSMRAGHVATVAKVVDDRHVLLNHANWSRPGMIEHEALAEDVSANGDWSEVRVYFAPIGKLGLRSSPTFGFIYNEAPERTRLALRD